MKPIKVIITMIVHRTIYYIVKAVHLTAIAIIIYIILLLIQKRFF